MGWCHTTHLPLPVCNAARIQAALFSTAKWQAFCLEPGAVVFGLLSKTLRLTVNLVAGAVQGTAAGRGVTVQQSFSGVAAVLTLLRVNLQRSAESVGRHSRA